MSLSILDLERSVASSLLLARILFSCGSTYDADISRSSSLSELAKLVMDALLWPISDVMKPPLLDVNPLKVAPPRPNLFYGDAAPCDKTFVGVAF